jgi:putative transposase
VARRAARPSSAESVLVHEAQPRKEFPDENHYRSVVFRRRDAKYTQSFDQILSAAGTAAVKLPPQSPNLNAFAERFVKSIKTECLEQFVLFGEDSLRHVICEYLAHYHAKRNHQGIKNVIPFPDTRLGRQKGTVVKAERLGGLLNFYHRQAA